MMKWIFTLILIPALLYAAGLRIDFEVLSQKFNKKADPNAEAMRQMGIDPSEFAKSLEPWWTFKKKDNLFAKLKKWDPVAQMSSESWTASEAIRANLKTDSEGPADEARAMAARIKLRETLDRLKAG